MPADIAHEAGGASPRVVVIGAGIGSLEAIQLFFAAMPAHRDLAFVICREVYSEITDHLSALLSHETSMPVHLAEHGIRLAPNAIYLMPPEARMVLVKGQLLSFDDDEDGLSALPLDLLFHALAASAGPEAIAILMSGEGEDGLRGAISIQRAGGLFLVQDPNSADCSTRLSQVIEAGLASAQCPAEAMPGLIGRFVDGHDPDPIDDDVASNEQAAFDLIFRHLATRFDLDLDAYRRPMVARRVRRRAILAKAGDLDAYAACLIAREHEADQLHDDLLSGVTTFFRDPEAFALLASKVVPALVDHVPADRPIRVWVPAAATGEEAFSLAMLLVDHLRERGLRRTIEITATDRDGASLDEARLACYAPEQVLHLPVNLIKRYMEPAGERLKVRDQIREFVTFKHHDPLQEAPFTGMDLVSCRNLLIFLAKSVRGRALDACRQALGDGGFLFLGPSDMPPDMTDDLAVIDRRWRIYRRMEKRPGEPAAIVRLPDLYRERPGEILSLDQASADDIGLSRDIRSAPYRPMLPSFDDQDYPGFYDAMLEQNQQMLESTIDTLLASNDALRRRNRDLRLENERLAAANTTLDDIATLVAHDLKAPLRAVDHLARRLEVAWHDKEERHRGDDDLRHLQLRLVGLHRLIDDLLTYARQDSMDQPVIERVDLSGLIREILALIGLPPGIRLEVRPPSVVVRTQRVPLECILRNLLADLIEHHGGTKGHVKIDIVEGDSSLDIRLEDDGQGPIGRRKGLGLAIVRQLLAAEGSHLAMTQSAAGGTEARFTWPITGTTLH